MWYGLVRIIFWYGLFFAPLIYLLYKKKIRKVLFGIIAFITFFAIFIPFAVSIFYPVENLIINFASPQSVITYSHSGNVIDVVQGENSCLIIYEPNHTNVVYSRMKNGEYERYGTYKNWYSSKAVFKSPNGYKLQNNNSDMKHYTRITNYKLDEPGSYSVFYIEGTNDYYLYGTTVLVDNEFELVYGYSNSIEGLENNLKRISVTLELGSLPTWEFVE